MDASMSTLNVFFAIAFSSTFAVALLATYWRYLHKQAVLHQGSLTSNYLKTTQQH